MPYSYASFPTSYFMESTLPSGVKMVGPSGCHLWCISSITFVNSCNPDLSLLDLKMTK